MITRIYIDNYRCFTNFEFVPARINLLLGANGTGKSVLFEVLANVVDLVVMGGDVAEVFPEDSRTRWDQRLNQRVELDVAVRGHAFRYTLVVGHEGEHGRARITTETVTCGGETLFEFQDGQITLHKNDGDAGPTFPFRGSKSFLAQIESRPETQNLMAWREFINGMWAIALNVRDIGATSREEHGALDRDGLNFASWYRHLSQEQPDLLAAIWSALERALPGFVSLVLRSAGDRGRARDLAARMQIDSTNYQLYFDELSDGQRALIVLYTLLEARAGEGCLLLDEPELHVGLAEVQPWLVELDSRFEDQGQVFIASQNSEVVDYLAAGDAFLFERPGGGPARARKAEFDREGGLTASEQLARGFANVG